MMRCGSATEADGRRPVPREARARRAPDSRAEAADRRSREPAHAVTTCELVERGEAMAEIIRRCRLDDATAVAAIYDPIVADTTISFENVPPGAVEIRRRIADAGDRFPWLVFERDGIVAGYVYASPHRPRPAYEWSVDVSAYVAPGARRLGVARRLYVELFRLLTEQGYCTAFAGVALPNEASCQLHEALGSRQSASITRSASSAPHGTTSSGSNDA